MSNGYASANCEVVTGSNGIPFPLTKPLHYINSFLLKNGTVAIKNGTVFCQNGYRPLGKRLGITNYWQLQRLPAEAAMGMGATAIPVPLKRPLPLTPVAVGAHLCS